MAKIPVGVQLFSVHGLCDHDALPDALRRVAAMGYQGAELFGYDGDVVGWNGRSGQELRKLLDDTGLACCGMHVNRPALEGDGLRRSIDLARMLGSRLMVMAGDSDAMSNEPGALRLAAFLTGVADNLKAEGLAVGYHAHPFDFTDFGDRTAWDVLFSNTPTEVVMQMDVGNCAHGGADPLGYLRKYPGRTRSLHVKDFGGAPSRAVGEGQADWAEVFRICDELQPVEWYVVEQATKGGRDFGPIERSIQFLKRIGRA